jgi:hypothetical protein
MRSEPTPQRLISVPRSGGGKPQEDGPTNLATHLSEALVDEGIRDVEQISDDGVSLRTRRIRKTPWIAPPILDVGVGDKQSDRQQEPFPKRAKQGTHDCRRQKV